MPEYIVHIGPHKTGSTYLQDTLKALCGFLREHGVLYPTDLGDLGHMQLPRKLLVPASRAELAAQFHAYAHAGCAKVVLSAEDLAPLDDTHIRLLHHLIGDHPVRIVYYCRSWVSVTVSNWGEQIRHGFATPLDEALAERLARPRGSPPINYGRALGRYADVFGRASLSLVALEGLTAAKLDTVTHFLQAFLGIGEPPPVTDVGRRNNALPLIDAELIRVLNAMRIERHGKRDSHMRRAYQRRRDQLDLTHTRAVVEQHIRHVVADETKPPLITLHRQLFAKYGQFLVPPHPQSVFFTPRRHEVAFIRRDYLADPIVQTELQASFAGLDHAAAARRLASA